MLLSQVNDGVVEVDTRPGSLGTAVDSFDFPAADLGVLGPPTPAEEEEETEVKVIELPLGDVSLLGRDIENIVQSVEEPHKHMHVLTELSKS